MMTDAVTTGRNEPCPCGSGKKYKRCCGVGAAPKLTPPKQPSGMNFPAMPGQSPAEGNPLANMDPQLMMQISQMLQRLPKGQMQRLQVLMQKAMMGKDIAQEAAEFEKTMPLEFQQLMHSMGSMGAMGNPTPQDLQINSELDAEPTMTPEEARALVAQAAAQGEISQEQAKALLSATESPSDPESGLESKITKENEKTSKFGKLWKNIAGKKSSLQ